MASGAKRARPKTPHRQRENTMKNRTTENSMKNRTTFAALAASLLLASVASATDIERDANAEIILQEGRTVLIYPTNGTFTVTEPGEVELLLVGGGGGGGRNTGQNTGSGGGGAGGVVTNTVMLQAGTYSIVVGAGGRNALHGLGRRRGRGFFNQAWRSPQRRLRRRRRNVL